MRLTLYQLSQRSAMTIESHNLNTKITNIAPTNKHTTTQNRPTTIQNITQTKLHHNTLNNERENTHSLHVKFTTTYAVKNMDDADSVDNRSVSSHHTHTKSITCNVQHK
jgi:hypothetical protein